MSDTVLKVEGVSKKYCRSLKHTMLYGATDLSRSFLGLNQNTERLRDGEFWAVDDVSFELKRGECLGLIGANGSGKSTLLKMLNGIFMPDKGRIEINGQVGALIEVGAGFHPMLTGRENIYVNGSILGMSKKAIDEKFDEIVDFAGIGEFIDSPVKHYSSGMHVRLGFSVAVHAEPDILLIDEVLAVGDARFRKKCFDKMNSFKDNGKTIIFVSHSIDTMRSLPTKSILMNQGKMLYLGDPKETVLRYMQMIFPEQNDKQKSESKGFKSPRTKDDKTGGNEPADARYCLKIIPAEKDVTRSFGAGGAWINWIKIYGLEKPNVFHGGENINIEVSYSWNQESIKNLLQEQNVDSNLLFGITFETKQGVVLTNLATALLDPKVVINPLKESTCIFNYIVQLPWLAGGDYFLAPGIALGRQENLVPLRRNENLVHLQCIPGDKYVFGLMNWKFDVKRIDDLVFDAELQT